MTIRLCNIGRVVWRHHEHECIFLPEVIEFGEEGQWTALTMWALHTPGGYDPRHLVEPYIVARLRLAGPLLIDDPLSGEAPLSPASPTGAWEIVCRDGSILTIEPAAGDAICVDAIDAAESRDVRHMRAQLMHARYALNAYSRFLAATPLDAEAQRRVYETYVAKSLEAIGVLQRRIAQHQPHVLEDPDT